jgi:hypothetical protein
MATRAEIETELEEALTAFEAAARALTPEQLVRPCTESEAPGSGAWSAKDHVAHVVRVERFFLGVATRAAAGDPDPIAFSRLGSNQDEVRAAIHRDNQRHVEELASRSLDQLFDDLRSARTATLAFIDAHEETVLATPVPGSPWGDGTIGGLLGRNAAHELIHLQTFQEGLARP